MWDSCRMEELSREGQLSLLIAPSIDPFHPLGSTKRLKRWPVFIELTPSGITSTYFESASLQRSSSQ
jgi:hypothetical protein